MRPTKDEYYLNIALAIAARGTCKRRNYGAVVVVKDEIISTGYSGSPRGTSNCLDLEDCPRIVQGITSGDRYDLCRSVHAEQNAIISASRADMIGGTMYIAGFDMNTHFIVKSNPCYLCIRFIIQAGIEIVKFAQPGRDMVAFGVININDMRYDGNG